ENASETRTAHLVFGGEIGAAEKRLAIRKQKTGERPAALPGDGADGGLVAGVDIGAFVAIHLYRHEMFIDHLGDFDGFVAFAVNNVAPVAPHGADIEKNGLVLGLGAFERGVTPFVPIDGLVCSGAEVGAGGVFQTVRGVVSQGGSQFAPANIGG